MVGATGTVVRADGDRDDQVPAVVRGLGPWSPVGMVRTRVNALIDPSMHIWHYEVPMYLFLGGLVAGLMVIAGMWMLRGPDGPDRVCRQRCNFIFLPGH